MSRRGRHTHGDNAAENLRILAAIDRALHLKRGAFSNLQCAACSDQGNPATALDMAGWFTTVFGSTKLITIDIQQ
jgi:hypothetical protein